MFSGLTKDGSSENLTGAARAGPRSWLPGLAGIPDGEWDMAEMPLVGEEFAGYRLVSVLGRGGMSIVFRAENPRLGNVIALKVLDPSAGG